VLLVLHRRSPGRDRAGLMDALIVATGLGLLAWTFLVVGFARQTGMPLAQAGAELARRTGTRCTVDAAPGLRLDTPTGRRSCTGSPDVGGPPSRVESCSVG